LDTALADERAMLRKLAVLFFVCLIAARSAAEEDSASPDKASAGAADTADKDSSASAGASDTASAASKDSASSKDSATGGAGDSSPAASKDSDSPVKGNFTNA
jgi:predicted lipid-binding transport protein (Tim44 family)